MTYLLYCLAGWLNIESYANKQTNIKLNIKYKKHLKVNF